jgi:hypothetical protein
MGYIILTILVMPNMPNPNPVQTEKFKSTWFRCDEDVDGELSKIALSAKVPISIDAIVRSLPNKSAWLRRVITEAARRELMGGDQL